MMEFVDNQFMTFFLSVEGVISFFHLPNAIPVLRNVFLIELRDEHWIFIHLLAFICKSHLILYMKMIVARH